MKGVILAAGKGSRLSELNLVHKSFAEIKKKHVIDYSLDLLSNLLINGKKQLASIVIVVGYHAESIIKNPNLHTGGVFLSPVELAP